MRGSFAKNILFALIALIAAGLLASGGTARSEAPTLAATVSASANAATATPAATITATSSPTIEPTVAATLAPTASPDSLENRVFFWDLGLTLNYPTNWGVAELGAGQLLLARSLPYQANANLNQVIIVLRIVDPVRQLGLTKDATFQQIAIGVNITSANIQFRVDQSGSALVAGLSAGYIAFTESTFGLTGTSVAFRVPDGRVGVLLGIGPVAEWAQFAPVFDKVRESALLLRPINYAVPQTSTGGTAIRFAQGGLRFTLPAGWQERDLGANVHLYLPSKQMEYVDTSGFSNGPQLSAVAYPMSGTSAQEALQQVIGTVNASKMQTLRIGTQNATTYTESDRYSGQAITFIGVTSADGRIFTVLRWTTPGMLTDVTKPLLDFILASIQFEPPSATLVPRRASATPSPSPTPKP